MTVVGRVQSAWGRAKWMNPFIHFARNPLRSYLNELPKNKIHFLNKALLFSNLFYLFSPILEMHFHGSRSKAQVNWQL